MNNIPTAFVSYSWDSPEHKNWVTGLVNSLRENGVDATIDVFETQRGTVNLYKMMLQSIKDRDFIIIIMTQLYAEKADAFQGGVGYETSMLIPLIQDNLQKIIPIMKFKGDQEKAVPFYLKGVHYIDFSDDSHFDEKFKELLYRLHKVNIFEEAPLGSPPDLKPKIVEKSASKKANDFDDLIPNLIEPTDIDKNRFMRQSFDYIKGGLLQILDRTKLQNANFNFDYENITSKKVVFRVYINGQQKYAVKIWLGDALGFRKENINLSYGNYITDSDNSLNEYISCEIAEDKSLFLKMHMNMFGNKDANTPDEIIREIWTNALRWIKCNR